MIQETNNILLRGITLCQHMGKAGVAKESWIFLCPLGCFRGKNLRSVSFKLGSKPKPIVQECSDSKLPYDGLEPDLAIA
jgi:hypothetical protein